MTVSLLFFLGAVSVFPETAAIRVSDDLELIPLTDNCYIHISYYDLKTSKHFPANGLVYVSGGQAVILDTPWTEEETRNLLDWVRNSLKVSIAAVVVTHWHIDCMGGLAEVHRRDIPSYSHVSTREIAKQKGLPVPAVGFARKLTLRLGDNEIGCHYLGAGHTRDNIVVWIRGEKLLFGGCLLKARAWRGLGFTGDSNLPAWPKTLKKVLAAFTDAQVVIPGHGEPGTLDLIHHTLDLLKKHTGTH